MSTRAFLWRYLRRYVGWIAIGTLAVILFSLASTAVVVLMKPLFGEVLKMDPPSGLAGGAAKPGANAMGWVVRWTDGAYQGLKRSFGVDEGAVIFFVPALLFGAFLLRALSDFLSGYAFQRIGFGATTDLRNDVYARLLQQSSRFHAQHPSGELVSRVVSDVAMMQSAVSNRLLDLFQYSLQLVALLFVLLGTHFKLALVCLVVLPLVLYPIVRFGKGIRRLSMRGQERLADLAHLVAEGVRGHRVVKAFGAEDYEERRFREATRRHLKVNLRGQTLANLSGPVVEVVGLLGACALFAYAGLQIQQRTLTQAVLLSFIVNLGFLYDPIRRLNRVNLILQQALAATHRVKDLLLMPNDVADPPHPRPFGAFAREIRFAKVGFAYDRDPVLRGVDLTVRRGEVVALVGASGAGKSTLANLLPRFFDPTGGAVTIDGIDLRELSLRDLRRQIALVTQETMLFDDTVRSNIAYGDPAAPEARVVEAAQAAYADEFVRQMPQGYDTRVGESGLRLSGGQRQRLAIARAIYKDAPILILDEATSQLDSESEALVQRALANLMRGRTTLVIAHRLSTVMRADRIVVLDEGRVIEEGNHAELLEQGGAYRRLYELQLLS